MDIFTASIGHPYQLEVDIFTLTLKLMHFSLFYAMTPMPLVLNFAPSSFIKRYASF